MSILSKIREKGLKESFRMIPVKLKKKTLSSKRRLPPDREQALADILRRGYRRVIVFENHFGFYNIMLQRPQHLTRALSSDDTLVLYNSFYDLDFHSPARLEQLDEHLYVLDLYHYRTALFRLLKDMQVDKQVMVYSTDTVALDMVRQYEQQGFAVIYEYVDDINPDLIAPSQLERITLRHEALIHNPNCRVVATAGKLYKNVLTVSPKARASLISNGADCTTFLTDAVTDDRDYLNWLQEDKIKVGYYGALASWVDYDLLHQIAQNPDFQLILIGVEHDSSLRESDLLLYDNVRYFGKKPFDVLPGYANCFDLCIIPFVLNDITEATSPVKLFEYMALQKPVVTTPLPECLNYPIVRTEPAGEGFIAALYELNAKKDDRDFKAALRQCALDNSWKAKAAQLTQILNKEAHHER